MSDGWERLADEYRVFNEDKVFHFLGPKGAYSIKFFAEFQDRTGNYANWAKVFKGQEEAEWDITRKDRRGDVYKISGSADWIPEIVPDYCWYELEIGPDGAKITYWGDRVIIRTDYEQISTRGS